MGSVALQRLLFGGFVKCVKDVKTELRIAPLGPYGFTATDFMLNITLCKCLISAEGLCGAL